jgi:opacity protein-like surface antigen
MKKSMYTAAVLAVLAAPSFAGGPAAVPEEPVPVAPAAPAAAYDWSGPYVGLAYGTASGSLDYDVPPLSYDLETGNVTSFFAGYQMQSGAMVYGGEFAISNGNDIYPTGFPDENVDQILDLKGKVGYATNRALFYGVLGYSQLDYEIPVLDDSISTSGISYGVGVDFAATDMFIVGLEYLARNTDGDSFFVGQTADIDVDTVSLRLGLSF